MNIVPQPEGRFSMIRLMELDLTPPDRYFGLKYTWYDLIDTDITVPRLKFLWLNCRGIKLGKEERCVVRTPCDLYVCFSLTLSQLGLLIAKMKTFGPKRMMDQRLACGS